MGGVAMKARKAQQAGGAAAGNSGAPVDGWIRTMRQARGVSLRQLGSKLGIKGNSVHVAERREIEGGISIYQLRRIAGALDCDLFYAFVPRQGGARPSQRYAAALRAREDISDVSVLKVAMESAVEAAVAPSDQPAARPTIEE
jgi:predicted DNA-binding mobile mystery protein A